MAGLIGNKPNQVPTNADLGPLAFRDENPVGDVVGTSDVQTLTNKTLTGGMVNPTVLQEGGSPAVVQSDIGREPNQIPLNQFLGAMAFRDESPAGAIVGTSAVQVLSGKSFSDNVGIGTTSPDARLTVEGAAANLRNSAGTFTLNLTGTSIVEERLTTSGAGYGDWRLQTGNDASGLSGSFRIYDVKAAADRLRIDASGNVGFGVTPGAWKSGYKALETAYGSFSSADNATIRVGLNAYQSAAGWVNRNTGNSLLFELVNGGGFQWRSAPSVAAGATPSFTQVMTLTESGNLGIGVTPSAWGAAYKAVEVNAACAIVGTSGASRIVNNAYHNGTSWLYRATIPAQMYEQVGTQHAWHTAPSGAVGSAISFTQAMTLDANGYLRLASGGIQFNGDTAAANALDDYEEGTFTPTIIGEVTAGVGTYTAQLGRYTKVGNRVHYNIVLAWTGHTGDGNMRIAGLPFTASAATNNQQVASVFHSSLSYTAGSQVFAIVNAGTTELLLRQSSAGAAATAIAFDTAASFYVSGHYEV